jgi:hypothetical protein
LPMDSELNRKDNCSAKRPTGNYSWVISAGCDSSKVLEAIGEADDLDRNHPLSA